MKKTTVTIQITGMHCVSCAMNIDFSLEDLAGVKDVQTDYARQKSIVTFDPDVVAPKQMIEKITKLGYEAVIKQ